MGDKRISSVYSNQEGVHEDLVESINKHLHSPWRQPTPDHTQKAAIEIIELIDQHRGPLILDSFCGTGMSTAALAELFPDSLVIGIDKSLNRLSKHVPGASRNYHLFRASCEHVWAALAKEEICLDRHYLLYPNPWPKKAHLKRRIHGHPAFPLLRTLGGVVQLRSNWLTYVEEFAFGMQLLHFHSQISEVHTTDPLTLFERKYSENKENLWQCESIPLKEAGADHDDCGTV